jgi:hypothetical protein
VKVSDNGNHVRAPTAGGNAGQKNVWAKRWQGGKKIFLPIHVFFAQTSESRQPVREFQTCR